MTNSITGDQFYKTRLEAGQSALLRGAWQEAQTCFNQALAMQETPEALEGLGMAAQWLNDAVLIFDARVRAYQQYLHHQDSRSAARVAALLAYDHFTFRGEPAVANGWLQRARWLLKNCEPGFEHGWLYVLEGYLALELDNDTAQAQSKGGQAAELAHALELLDVEMMGLALKGLARVCAGEIQTGMQLLDGCAVAAASGDIADPDAQTIVCCYLLRACEYVRDYERAVQWCDYLKAISTYWHYPMMFAYCRVHYACVLLWRGAWTDAEAILQTATQDLLSIRPTEAGHGVVHLAELRRKQGRFDEAEKLLTQAESHPLNITGGHHALLGRAALALDRGDPATAEGFVERFLRRIPPENRMERPRALELLMLAGLALDKRELTQTALDELVSIAEDVATDPLQAMLHYVSGIVAFADKQYLLACSHFEDAVDLFVRSNAPFETGRAHIGLAQTLFAMGRLSQAQGLAEHAQSLLQPLGAVVEHAKATDLLDKIVNGLPACDHGDSFSQELTHRELEVLRLMVAGKSNHEIADSLVLSVRTVERHISNIYAKLGLQGKAARANVIAYAYREGIVPTL